MIPLFIISVRNIDTALLNMVDLEGDKLYGAAMTLAWNHFSSLTKEKQLIFQTKDQDKLAIINKFKISQFSKNSINRRDYCIGSGIGPVQVQKIQSECSKKFPGKELGLDFQAGQRDLVIYALIIKNLQFQVPFEKTESFKFKDVPVKGLRAGSDQQKQQVHILNYTSDDKFILQIKLKNKLQKLYLLKGYSQVPDLSEMRSYTVLDSMDYFGMPFISLEEEHSYQELKGLAVKNVGFDGVISQMKQRFIFNLNQKGVHLQNDATIVELLTAVPPQNDPKWLGLDSPFWLVLGQEGHQPYFMVHIQTTRWLLKQ